MAEFKIICFVEWPLGSTVCKPSLWLVHFHYSKKGHSSLLSWEYKHKLKVEKESSESYCSIDKLCINHPAFSPWPLLPATSKFCPVLEFCSEYWLTPYPHDLLQTPRLQLPPHCQVCFHTSLKFTASKKMFANTSLFASLLPPLCFSLSLWMHFFLLLFFSFLNWHFNWASGRRENN